MIANDGACKVIIRHVVDVTYSYNPGGTWTAQHQMSINGKRDNITLENFSAFAKVAGMKRGRDKTILQEVQGAVAMWDGFATETNIPKSQQVRIAESFRMNLPAG